MTDTPAEVAEIARRRVPKVIGTGVLVALIAAASVLPKIYLGFSDYRCGNAAGFWTAVAILWRHPSILRHLQEQAHED